MCSSTISINLRMCKLQVLYLIILLFFSQVNSREYIQYISLSPNQSINIKNVGYPREYPPGTSGSYLLKAPVNHVIDINCGFTVYPNQCQSNHLLISLDGDMTFDGAERFCRSTTVVFTSYFQSLALSYESTSKWTKQRAQLKCHAVARPVPCNCGWSQAKRIANGVEAGPFEFPSMAALLDRSTKRIFCGGSIISDRYIVTAAHCTTRRTVWSLVALVGVHDLSKRARNPSSEHSIQRIFVHPEYNSRTDDNDIALLLTTVSIEWSRRVAPICLPYKSPSFYDTPTVEVAGWGTMGFTKKTSNTLQKATLKAMLNEFCSKALNKTIPYNQVCTFDEAGKGRDSCQFDSGGPVIQRLRERQFLYGVISYGQSCGLQSSVGVNTRITNQLIWISNYVYNSVCVR